LKRFAPIFLLPLMLIAAGDPPRNGSGADLEAELDALLREIEGGPYPMLDPGAAPDLVIASTRQVLGELAPCG
jgi:hypothetical protein